MRNQIQAQLLRFIAAAAACACELLSFVSFFWGNGESVEGNWSA